MQTAQINRGLHIKSSCALHRELFLSIISSLLLAHPYDQEMVEGIFDLILEKVLSKNGEITIAGDVYPKNLVKSKFLKLNYSHVEYVINCLGKNTTKVRNIKSYLLTSLFNAGSTISSYYRAEVNHDMPQYAG